MQPPSAAEMNSNTTGRPVDWNDRISLSPVEEGPGATGSPAPRTESSSPRCHKIFPARTTSLGIPAAGHDPGSTVTALGPDREPVHPGRPGVQVARPGRRGERVACAARSPVAPAVADALRMGDLPSRGAEMSSLRVRARRRAVVRSDRAAEVALPCRRTRQSRGTSYAKTSEHEALPRVRGRRPGRAVHRYRIERSGGDRAGPRGCGRGNGCLGRPRLLGVVGGGCLALRVLAVRRRRPGPGSRTWRDRVRCGAGRRSQPNA